NCEDQRTGASALGDASGVGWLRRISRPDRRRTMWRSCLLVTGLVVVLLSAAAPALEPPTFSDALVRIFQARCQACPRPGEHAPFSLLPYRDAYARRDEMRDAVTARVMPPWKPVPGFGEFLEPRRLSDQERATLVDWLDA